MPLSKIHSTLTSDHILLDGTDGTGANANSRVLLDASASDTDEGIIMSYEAGADDASVALTPPSFTLDALNITGTTTTIPDGGTIGSASSTSAIRISSEGNFLVHSTGEGGRTHIISTTTDNDDGLWALKVMGTSTNTDTTGPYGVWVNFPNATPDNNSSNDFLFASDATASRFIIISSGDFWSSDGGWVDSDENLKENITDASSKLDDVLKLKVRNFNWKESHHPSVSDKKLIGFIAQEMETVFPGLVDEHDINPEGKNGTPNMKKGVKTTALIPILTKALQELSAKVETLETKVAKLEEG